MYVVERLIDAVCQIDYPRELLEIQVLDDSTDETLRHRARVRGAQPRSRATTSSTSTATNRQGFKAGALENGLKLATGEFVAVFDADFVPEPGLPQAHGAVLRGRARSAWCRCAGATSTASTRILTQAQSHLPRRPLHHRAHRAQPLRLLLQLQRHRRHLAPQHHRRRRRLAARHAHRGPGPLATARSSRAGSSSSCPRSISPAEVPVDMNAFKSQQHRWAKGSIQTAKKLLPTHPAQRPAAAR